MKKYKTRKGAAIIKRCKMWNPRPVSTVYESSQTPITKAKIHPALAWAIVNEKKIKIDPMYVFSDKEVKLNKDELLLRVEIIPYRKKRK